MSRDVALVDMAVIEDAERLAVAAREGLARLEDAAAPGNPLKVKARDWAHFGIWWLTPDEEARRKSLRPRQFVGL